MDTYSFDTLHRKMMEMHKRDWERECPDTEIYLEMQSLCAKYRLWELTMHWTPRNVGGFELHNGEDICNAEMFHERFRGFVAAAKRTDCEEVKGKYLHELLEGKNFWIVNTSKENKYSGSGKELKCTKEGEISVSKIEMERFWRNYVVKTDQNRKIRKKEEVYWFILAWIYFHGKRYGKKRKKQGDATDRLDELKIIMSSRKDSKDINEVIRWCIGCYMDMCFLPDNQEQKHGKGEEGLIGKFGKIEYLGGLFDFSEYFEYKENHIEGLLAEMLEMTLYEDVEKYPVGNWSIPLYYVEHDLQLDAGDYEEEGLFYPISKGFRREKHAGGEREISRYSNGTKNGLRDYFVHHQELAKLLEMPKFTRLRGDFDAETVGICLENYKRMKKYLYRRFMGAFFVRLWPDKNTYMNLCLVRSALDALEEAICVPVDEDMLREAEAVQSLAWESDALLEMLADAGLEDSDKELIENFLKMPTCCPLCGEVDNVETEEDEEGEDEEDGYDVMGKLEEVKTIVDGYIVCGCIMKPILEKQDGSKLKAAEEYLGFDKDAAVACLNDMFQLYP